MNIIITAAEKEDRQVCVCVCVCGKQLHVYALSLLTLWL